MQQKILISRSYPLKRQENIEIMPFYVDYKGLLIYMVTRMVAQFVSSGRTRLFIGEIHIHGAGRVGKGALSENSVVLRCCSAAVVQSERG
jgi:hypothetical protein